jgi:hypothetical protein
MRIMYVLGLGGQSSVVSTHPWDRDGWKPEFV